MYACSKYAIYKGIIRICVYVYIVTHEYTLCKVYFQKDLVSVFLVHYPVVHAHILENFLLKLYKVIIHFGFNLMNPHIEQIQTVHRLKAAFLDPQQTNMCLYEVEWEKLGCYEGTIRPLFGSS